MQGLQWPREPPLSAVQQWRSYCPTMIFQEASDCAASCMLRSCGMAAQSRVWQITCIGVQRFHSVITSLV